MILRLRQVFLSGLGLCLLSASLAAAPVSGTSEALFAAVGRSDAVAVARLANDRAVVNARNEAGLTPLMAALDCCCTTLPVNLDVVRALLADGADPNARDGSGTVVLERAIYADSMPALKALLGAGANPNASEQDDETPLLRAVEQDHADMVQALLEAGAKLGSGTQQEKYLATAGKNVEIARLLVGAGAQVNQPDQFGDTALMAASAAVAQFLISKGAQVNARDAHGESALGNAASNGNQDVARVLLEAGADANIADGEKSTPLIGALISSEPDDASFVQLLLEHGARPDGTGENSPVYWAAKTGAAKALQLLIDKGANANVARRGTTALLEVLKEGNNQRTTMQLYALGGVLTAAQQSEYRKKSDGLDVAIVKCLLDHGVDPTKGANRACLLPAAGGGITDIVQLLIAHGAPVNIGDDAEPWPALFGLQHHFDQEKINPAEMAAQLEEMRDRGYAPRGFTPLLAAVNGGFAESVQLLLDAGADVHVKDCDGRGVLHVLAAGGRNQIARMVPQYREGYLHHGNDFLNPKVAPVVTPAEAERWRQWAVAGDTGMVASLLAKGADLNARDANGRTPLMAAAAMGSPEVVAALLKAGAKANAVDSQGQTAVMQVVLHGRIARAPELFSPELAELVDYREKSVQPNNQVAATRLAATRAKFNAQRAAVLQAATAGDIAMLQQLVAAGADLKVRDKQGHTALQLARVSKKPALAAWFGSR